MKSVILQELAKRWEQDAQGPNTAHPDDVRGNFNRGHDEGQAETLRKCAEELKVIAEIFYQFK